jgi:hypothetical protein
MNTPPARDQQDNCEIHGSTLQAGVVLVMYGLYRFTPEYLAAQRTAFPHSRFIVLGGCMVGDEMLHTTRHCAECRRAHVAWCRQHGSGEGLPPDVTNLEAIVRRRFGEPSAATASDEVRQLLAAGRHVAALKALKQANPGVLLEDLRSHLRYLQHGHDIEAARAALLDMVPYATTNISPGDAAND